MARVFMSGAEAGSTDVFTTASAVTLSTVQKRTGAYSFYFPMNGYLTKTLPAALTELYLRMGVYPVGWAPNDAVMLMLYPTVGNYQVYLRVNKGTNLLEYCMGPWYALVVLATGTHPIVLGAWQCIEIWPKIANSGGRFVLKIDGAIDIDYTGDTQDVEDNIRKVSFLYYGTNAGILGYLDDIAINDTSGPVNNSWIGTGGIYPKYMSGVGAYTDLHASAGNPWDCIKEVPPNDADYVYDDTVNQKSSYTGTALTPVSGTIAAINVIMRAKLDAAGTGNIARLVRSNGVDSQGADVGLDVSAKTIQEIIETDPGAAPGTPWTIPRVNAMQAGATVR
jgi:hypothetical protein